MHRPVFTRRELHMLTQRVMRGVLVGGMYHWNTISKIPVSRGSNPRFFFPLSKTKRNPSQSVAKKIPFTLCYTVCPSTSGEFYLNKSFSEILECTDRA